MKENKQELYQKIRERINELVPRMREYGKHIFKDNQGNTYEYCLICGEINPESELCKSNCFTSTPHLEDLLEAIGKNGLECEIDESGNLTKDMNHLAFYDLSLSLENQELETLEELNRLLN